MSFKNFITAGAVTISLSVPAYAENLAVIVSNLSYKTQVDLASGPGVARIRRALNDAGFTTIVAQNMKLSTAVTRLRDTRRRMSEADRLIIIVNGHVVTSAGNSWLLSPRAERPSDFTIGVSAVPLAPLFAAAGRHPGAALVAVIEQRRPARVSAGVTPSFVEGDVPQGVTLLTGDVVAMADAFENGLLEEGRTMTSALAAHPNVTGSGYVPTLSGVLPGTGAPVEELDRIVEDPEPELTPTERLAAAERAMGLSREDRRKVQRSLALLGFDPSGIDGLFGNGTRRAVRAYQADRDFPATGFLSPAVVNRLWDEADARSAQLEEEARQRRAAADARDTAYWRDTGQGGDESGMNAYLRRYPDGLFAEVAKSRLQTIEDARRPVVTRAEQRAWNRAFDENSKASYRAYLQDYPDGAYRLDAEAQLAEIAQAEDAANASKKYAAAEKKAVGNPIARKLVENRLKSLGLDPGRIDGEFDDDTRRALRRFQEARGLNVTGYVNQATMVRILIGN